MTFYEINFDLFCLQFLSVCSWMVFCTAYSCLGGGVIMRQVVFHIFSLILSTICDHVASS